jgi:hypothetical protein
MDPMCTTAVVALRIWQMRGGVQGHEFLVSNYASSLIPAPRPREVDTRVYTLPDTVSRPLNPLKHSCPSLRPLRPL